MNKYIKILVLVTIVIVLVGCDKVNKASRTMDTMLGGDFEVYVVGREEPFIVDDGKVTSVPGKGYYVYYPMINGKEQLVQSPIQTTTIIKTN